MTASIRLADHATRDDLRVMLERLIRVGEGEVRLVSRSRALAVYGCTQTSAGLLDTTPVVLVMRVCELAEEPAAPIDTTVQIRALLDRLARMGFIGLDLDLPDTEVTAVWAGVLPPHGGWEPGVSIDAPSLAEVARDGSERITAALPDQPGEAIVQGVRRTVWGVEVAPGVPAAAAFAAEAMGFLADESIARLAHTRTWTRLSTGRGHVLVRQSSPAMR